MIKLEPLPGESPRLEFAIGTGHVAVPLSQRGVPVTGIELSGPIIEQLRTEVDEAAIPVIAGDMATTWAPGTYTLVYVVYSTSGQQEDSKLGHVLGTASRICGFRAACSRA